MAEPSDDDRRRLAIDLARGEVDSWIRHYDAVDAKTGILLGFSAALVALGGGQDPVLVEQIGRLLAVAATGTAAASLWPRSLDVPKTSHFCADLARRASNTEGRLVGTYLKAAKQNRRVAERKQRWQTVTIVMLLLAVAAFALPTACQAICWGSEVSGENRMSDSNGSDNEPAPEDPIFDIEPDPEGVGTVKKNEDPDDYETRER